MGRWLLWACGLVCAVGGLARAPDRILLEDVQALTFYKGQMTRARRTSPIAQLQCVAGDAKGQFVPDVVQCRNVGRAGRGDVQWECKADMDDEYRFGWVRVNCEGYDNADDECVLQGSCGLEFSLEHAPGRRQSKMYHNAEHSYHRPQYSSSYHSSYQDPYHHRGSGGGNTFLFLMLAAVAAYVFFYKGRPGTGTGSATTAGGRTTGGWSGGGGGGGGGGFGGGGGGGGGPRFSSSGTCHAGGSNTYTETQGAAPPPRAAQQPWGPGFWTTLLGGGALGYLMGGQRPRMGYGMGHGGMGLGGLGGMGYGGGGFGGGGGAAFGGGGAGLTQRTGFGGTTRR